MKKLFFFLSAIALLGMATACVEQLQVNNPNYNAERGEVKTDFTINIAGPVATKATAATAQAGTAVTENNETIGETGSFRGMSDMTLFVLKGAPASNDFESTYYPLGTLGTNDISTTQSSKIYNLSFPTGVKNMVFYAKATASGTNAANGKIAWPTVSNGTKKADMVFGLTPIASETTDFDTEAGKIEKVLNDIVAAFGNVTVDGYDANLKKAYDLFTTVKTTELRLGSAPAITRMLTDLRKTVTNIQAVEVEGSTVYTICSNVLAKITTTPGTISGVQSNFPADLGLPEGAAQLSFDTQTKKFAYVTTHGAVDNTTATGITKYTYPVELCYWVSSEIRTSTDPDIVANDYPKTVSDWKSWTSSATGWANKWVDKGTISSATRAVALRENIQYANALMKTTVSYSSADLKDNNSVLNPGEQDATVTKNFEVKGILVGKQPSKLGWNLKDAIASTNSDAPNGTTWDNVIYDTVFDAKTIPTATNKPLYTMVFANTANADDKVVNIALELVNKTEKDFWGQDNLIPAGGTFYIAAQLKLNQDDTFESVFMQDYVTTVNLTIGANSLKKAYATVPDLRSVAMTFGLSVDLTWQSGKEFNIELGNQTSGN